MQVSDGVDSIEGVFWADGRPRRDRTAIPDDRMYRVLISPRILVVKRWLRVRSGARGETSRMVTLRGAMHAEQEGAVRARVVELFS